MLINPFSRNRKIVDHEDWIFTKTEHFCPDLIGRRIFRKKIRILI